MVRAPARASPEQNILSGTRSEVVQKIQINGVANFVQLRTETRGPVEVPAQLVIRRGAHHMPPTRYHIAARCPMGWILNHRYGRRGIQGNSDSLPIAAFVQIALHVKKVTPIRGPISAKAKLPHLPFVKILPVGVELRA